MFPSKEIFSEYAITILDLTFNGRSEEPKIVDLAKVYLPLILPEDLFLVIG